MKTVTVNRFDNGWADDRYNDAIGQFAVSKHFDIMTYPGRLVPFRGMTSDTADTYIGNIIVGSDGSFYGLGGDPANDPGDPGADVGVWKRSSGTWTQFTNSIGHTVDYNCFFEYHDSSGNRVFIHGSGQNKVGIIRMDDSAATTQGLTATNFCQGFVHPKNDVAYVGYDNKIASNDNGTWVAAKLTLPANYRVTALSYWGNYLAIALTTSVGGIDYIGEQTAKVALWDVNSQPTTPSEIIDYGAGNLKVINNLDGALIGIMEVGGSSIHVLDSDRIRITSYTGGVPQPLTELNTEKLTSSVPSAVIEPRVNFVYRNRLYFSAEINGGSTSPSYRGLWSIGKSKISGRYAVSLERTATDDNSETGVIAAAISGDNVSMVYNAVGTLVFTNTTASTSAQYTATSTYESLVNPKMEELDRVKKKQLLTFAIHCYPLVSGNSITAYYRVDTVGDSAWVEIFTKTITSPDTAATAFESTKDINGDSFKSGRNFEFKITSTGGAQITGFTYKYTTLESNI